MQRGWTLVARVVRSDGPAEPEGQGDEEEEEGIDQEEELDLVNGVLSSYECWAKVGRVPARFSAITDPSHLSPL